MKVKGREHAEWGFRKPEDGWHVVEMLEGIDILKNKEGEIAVDGKGNTLYKFPAKINQESAADHGLDISQIVAESSFGEQKIADMLAGAGLFNKFDEKYPGEHSYFEKPIMDTIKIKLPGTFCKMKTETSKDGKYSNVVEIASMKYNPEDKPGKVEKKAAKAAAATAPATGDEW